MSGEKSLHLQGNKETSKKKKINNSNLRYLQMQSKQINNKERVCRGNNTALVTVKMTFTVQHEHIKASIFKK